MLTEVFSRSCDGCQECCFHTPVLPLAKPEMTRCQFQCSEGCAVYEFRPSACSTYRCSWLAGELPEWAKPDQCGLLFETAWLNPGKGRRFVLITGWMIDPQQADPFRDRFPELLQYANVVAILDVPGDGQLVLARDAWSEDVFRSLAMKVAHDGNVQYRQIGTTC